MIIKNDKIFKSHGDGSFCKKDFKHYGNNIIIEKGVLIFHPETISLANNIYIGHNTILKGYYKNYLEIGEGTWIGQNCFLHSAGKLKIGKAVGIGPCVKILSSYHMDSDINIPVMHNTIEFEEVVVKDGVDIGVGAIILPGVRIGKGSIIGAGSVITRDVEEYTVVAGNPARLLRKRK